MELRTAALKGIVWSAARDWGSRVVRFVVFAVLAQLLPQSAFGIVALGGTYLAFVRVFVDQGFADAIIQRDELEPGHLDTAFWVNLGLAFVMTGGSIALAPWIGEIFREPSLSLVIQLLSPSFVLAALSGVQQAYIERELSYQVLAIREFIAGFSGGLVAVGMALGGFGVWSLVGMMLMERVAAVIVLWTASEWRPGLQVSVRHFKHLFQFGISVLGTNLLDYVNSRADNLIIGYFLGTTALGYYDVAYKLFQNGIDAITRTAASVAFSTFSRLQSNRDRMRQGFLTAAQVVSVVAFPMFAGTAVVAPDFIGLLFGSKWVPLSAQIYQVLAVGGMLQCVMYFNSPVILACGKPHWRLGITLLNAGLNVVLFVWAVQWGVVAVAVAFVGRSYLVAPLQVFLVHMLISLSPREYFAQFATPLLATTVLIGILWGGTHVLLGAAGTIAGLAVAGLAGSACYVAVVYFVDRALFSKIVDLVRSATA